MALTYTLSLSEAKLQKKISAMMPIVREKSYFNITLSEPEIELIEETNEMGVYLLFAVETWRGIKMTGFVKTTGILSYEMETSEFFFKNISLEKIDLDKISDKFNSVMRYGVQWVVTKAFATRAIYRLKDNNLKHKLAKATLQSVSVKDKKLLLELSVL